MNEYIVGEVIGFGSFSTVYKAKNKKTHETVAIKIAKIEKERRNEDNQLIDQVLLYDMKRITKEIELWKPLKHANLCQLLEVVVDEAEENVSFVMEYAKDGDLLTLLNEADGDILANPRGYFKQLCEAVKYLHSNGIIHCDIKLENILLSEGQVKLSDFGLAGSVNMRSQFERNNCGSVEYAAPELLMDSEAKYDDPFKADIWSLGVVLYALMYKQFPFDAPTPKILKVRILTLEPKYPIEDGVDAGLVEILKMLLQKKAERRPRIEELLGLLEGN